MHVAYLTGVYIHQDEPWYLNILCVRVTCKVHKSRKPGDNCTQVTCHYSWRGGRYLQETIPLGFHQCQLIAEKDEQITGPNSVASSFRTLGWSSSGPKASEGFKPLRSLITLSLETAISFMKGADLSRSGTWVCSFLLNTDRWKTDFCQKCTCTYFINVVIGNIVLRPVRSTYLLFDRTISLNSLFEDISLGRSDRQLFLKFSRMIISLSKNGHTISYQHQFFTTEYSSCTIPNKVTAVE